MTLKTKIVFILTFFLVPACSSKQKVEKTNGPKSAAVVSSKKSTPAVTTQAKEIKCTSGKDKRVISVQPLNGGCQVVYSKLTEISPIANSQNGMGHCESVASQMQKKLEGAGFKCN
ncbi:MAG: hypothetical protein AB7F59_01505 [Bdellovibrionales bacterium]